MQTAELTYYNPTRGFGFLGHRPDSCFVHAIAFEKAGIEPTLGQTYRFGVSAGLDGRERAVDLALDDGFLDV